MPWRHQRDDKDFTGCPKTHAISHKSLQGSENAERYTQKQINSSTRLAEIKQALNDWGLTKWSDDDWLFASVLRGQDNNLMSNRWANQLISYRSATNKEVETPWQATSKGRQLDKWNRQAKSERTNAWLGGPPALFALLCQPETRSPRWGIQWCTGLGGSVHSPFGGWGSKIVNWRERASGLVFRKPGWKRIMMAWHVFSHTAVWPYARWSVQTSQRCSPPSSQSLHCSSASFITGSSWSPTL